MPSQKTALVCLVCTLFSGAMSRAQPVHFDVSLRWTEVVAGSNTPVAFPNGVLDQGEAALVSLSVSFSPPVGTLVPYQYPSPGGIAPIAGFAGIGFSMIATSALGGDWSSPTSSQGFDVGLSVPLPDGSILLCGATQTPSGSSFPNPVNPLPDLWRAVWTPSTYSSRQVSFAVEPAADGAPRDYVYLGTGSTGNPFFGWAYGTNTTYTPISFPVAPCPASMVAVLGMAFISIRGRRPGCASSV